MGRFLFSINEKKFVPVYSKNDMWGMESYMTVKKPKISKAGKAQKISDKATLKMHNDVTASLEQLEHPEVKAKKKSGFHNAISTVRNVVARKPEKKLKRK